MITVKKLIDYYLVATVSLTCLLAVGFLGISVPWNSGSTSLITVTTTTTGGRPARSASHAVPRPASANDPCSGPNALETADCLKFQSEQQKQSQQKQGSHSHQHAHPAHLSLADFVQKLIHPLATGMEYGYWGKPSSTVDWCEPNYSVSYYIAEFFNTFSSLAMVFVGLVGMWMHRGPQFENRYKYAFGSVAIVGVGSAAFHGTLLFSLQVSADAWV